MIQEWELDHSHPTPTHLLISTTKVKENADENES
jgi:hypothetical protein